MMFSVEFDQLKELRRGDDPTLDQGEWVTEIKRADWPAALTLCGQLLATRTKDLRLAAWWTESAAHVHGFGGLADGLLLYAGLCEAHWEHVHPLPDEADQELRIGSITWLLGAVRALCRNLPVLRHNELSLSLTDIDAARQRALSGAAAPSAAGNAAASGKPAPATMDVVTRAQRATPAASMLERVEGARRIGPALARLQQVIDARLGADGPGFAPTRDAVQTATTHIERLAREMGALPAGDAATTTSAGAPSADETARAAVADGVVMGAPASRAQALAQLRSVAEFFRRTEPHSPVAYLADRAARWGEMPLHEWLRAVLKEQATLSQIEELLGVPAPPSPPADGG